MTYGMPTGSNSGGYGGNGVEFPDWVYKLGNAFNCKPSTYPGHQESDRNEAGYAPNPQHLNRGIDWAGSVPDMQRLADYLFSIKGDLEQVIWWNPQTNKRIGVAGGKDVTTTPYYDYPGGYDDHRDHVHTRQSKPIPLEGEAVPDNRPDFNEYPMWSPNNSARGGTKVDLFLLHTQEGPGNADSLAKYLQGHDVSYHYTISQADDGGVTVVDVVDTDEASWSVLSANSRSINLCFAGSAAAWTRDDWLKQSKAIDVAAYIAVQDCRKYGIKTLVVPPPYTGTPGISDHQYVTKVLKDGTHTDVGPSFPWDIFTAAVAKYTGAAKPPAAPPAPAAPRQFPKDYSDRELLEWIVAQLGVGDPSWPSKGMTLRDKVWSL